MHQSASTMKTTPNDCTHPLGWEFKWSRRFSCMLAPSAQYWRRQRNGLRSDLGNVLPNRTLRLWFLFSVARMMLRCGSPVPTLDLLCLLRAGSVFSAARFFGGPVCLHSLHSHRCRLSQLDRVICRNMMLWATYKTKRRPSRWAR